MTNHQQVAKIFFLAAAKNGITTFFNMATPKKPPQIYKDFLGLVETKLPIKIGALLVESANENIEQQKDIHGKPLKKRKSQRGKKGSQRNNGAVLVDTGAMKRSVRKQTGKGTVKILAKPYTKYHQEGGENLDKREFIGIGDETKEELDNLIEEEIGDFFRGLGFEKK